MNQYLGGSPQERLDIMERRRRLDPSLTNQEIADAFAIDPYLDPNELSLEEIDPSNQAYFLHGTHWRHFERLRREDPVHYHDFSMYGPYWSVTRYDDIKEVDTRHDLFSSHWRHGGISIKGIAGGGSDEVPALPMLVSEDPPKHDEQRNVLAPMFTASSLRKLEPVIRERAIHILENLPRNEEFDWVRHVAVELTGQMLATLFGVPQEDRVKLIEWSDAATSLSDPGYFETAADATRKLFECGEYFQSCYQERKAKPPTHDLISLLAHGSSTGAMEQREFVGNIIMLIAAGNDTTRNSISGGVLALNEHPGEYEKLRRDRGVIANMVAEIIRWQSPVIHMARTATRDAELGGKTIREGDRVVMWYISGNRDEEAIPRAHEFLIDRADVRKHLAFGYGIHRCMGSRLAEMQMNVLWEEIMKRLPHIEVTADPVRYPSNFVHGIRQLSVRIPE